MPQDLTPETISPHLVGRFGRALRCVAVTGSTHVDALAWAAAGAPCGAVVVADHQTAGRGRWDRSWVDAPGSSLMFSVVLRPALARARLGLVPVAAGLAVALALEELAGLPVRLKWPNDVMSRGRKLAGILVESRFERGELQAAVCGIGVNLRQRPEDFPSEIAARATSVAVEVEALSIGRVPGRAELLGAILRGLEHRVALLEQPSPPEDLLAESAQRSEVLGRAVVVGLADGTSITGVARRQLASGALELETPRGTVVVDSGEVRSLRPA